MGVVSVTSTVCHPSIPNFISPHPCISSSCVFSVFLAWHISSLPFVLSRLLLQTSSPALFGARADNTTLTYLNGFKRWRSWASSFPRLLCCRRPPPMLPCICLVSFKRPLLHPWFSQPFTASVWRTILLVYSLPLVIHSHRRS